MVLRYAHYPNCRCGEHLRNYCNERRLKDALANAETMHEESENEAVNPPSTKSVEIQSIQLTNTECEYLDTQALNESKISHGRTR